MDKDSVLISFHYYSYKLKENIKVLNKWVSKYFYYEALLKKLIILDVQISFQCFNQAS